MIFLSGWISNNLVRRGPTTLESLFKYPAVFARHRDAPFFEKRDCYLKHRAEQGCAHKPLLRIYAEVDLEMKIKALAQCQIPESAIAFTDHWSKNLELIKVLHIRESYCAYSRSL